MIVEELTVVAFDGTDISDLTKGLTLFESINGFIKGSIQIQDGVNFYDIVIGIPDRLVPVEISFTHNNIECTNNFFIDGITNMTIKKSVKEYTMHLISPFEQTLKLSQINEVFSGTSDEIVSNIFETITGPKARIIIEAKAITKGKYIVPNISAKSAIANVVNGAIDNQRSGFYFYQRLYDWGGTRLSSLRSMTNNFFRDKQNNDFEITSNIPTQQEIGTWQGAGTANDFTISEYKMNYTDKLASGVWGYKINHIKLDETKVIKNNPLERTSTEITEYKTSDNLYDNNVKNLFASANDPDNIASVNERIRIRDTILKISDMTPIPTIGCGYAIKVSMGGSDRSISISDGAYIISDINHIFTWEGNSFDYIQNMTLIREMA